MDCSKITTGLQAVDCAKPPVPGTGARVILVNYADIDKSLSVVNSNIVSSLVLSSAAKGFEFESLENTTEGTATYNKGTYWGNWQHDLILRMFARSEEAKAFVNQLNGARVVAIVENKDGGAGNEAKYEVYGWDAGLELNESANSTTMTDLVVYQVTLGSSETAKESTLPKSVYSKSLAETKTMLNALVA